MPEFPTPPFFIKDGLVICTGPAQKNTDAIVLPIVARGTLGSVPIIPDPGQPSLKTDGLHCLPPDFVGYDRAVMLRPVFMGIGDWTKFTPSRRSKKNPNKKLFQNVARGLLARSLASFPHLDGISFDHYLYGGRHGVLVFKHRDPTVSHVLHIAFGTGGKKVPGHIIVPGTTFDVRGARDRRVDTTIMTSHIRCLSTPLHVEHSFLTLTPDKASRIKLQNEALAGVLNYYDAMIARYHAQ